MINGRARATCAAVLTLASLLILPAVAAADVGDIASVEYLNQEPKATYQDDYTCGFSATARNDGFGGGCTPDPCVAPCQIRLTAQPGLPNPKTWYCDATLQASTAESVICEFTDIAPNGHFAGLSFGGARDGDLVEVPVVRPSPLEYLGSYDLTTPAEFKVRSPHSDLEVSWRSVSGPGAGYGEVGPPTAENGKYVFPVRIYAASPGQAYISLVSGPNADYRTVEVTFVANNSPPFGEFSPSLTSGKAGKKCKVTGAASFYLLQGGRYSQALSLQGYERKGQARQLLQPEYSRLTRFVELTVKRSQIGKGRLRFLQQVWDADGNRLIKKTLRGKLKKSCKLA